MKLTEDEAFRELSEKCMRCLRKTLLPSEYEWSFVACGCNINKKKTELSQNSKKKQVL